MVDQKVYEKLKEVASIRSNISYSELADSCDLPFDSPINRTSLFKKLQDICSFENSEGRPMLGVVVTKKDGSGSPGPGFFELAKKIGKMDQHTDENEFLRQETKRAWDHWSGHKQP